VSKNELHNGRETVNPRTGKVERVFVNLEAIYPDRENPSHEMSLEELRAVSRGWMDKDWSRQRRKVLKEVPGNVPCRDPPTENVGDTSVDKVLSTELQGKLMILDKSQPSGEAVGVVEVHRDGRGGKARRLKVREIKGETQTSSVDLPFFFPLLFYSFSFPFFLLVFGCVENEPMRSQVD
jgi:checkpoint serine/threonine-protein kinase